MINSYADYKAKIKNIQAQIGFKIRGFSNKDKFKLVLDSKSPTNTANIFVPEENYKLIYNTSSAVELIKDKNFVKNYINNTYDYSV